MSQQPSLDRLPERDQIYYTFYPYYVRQGLISKIFWMNIPCWKLPLDTWVCQELLFKYDKFPDYIIETGTAHGGSALFYACMYELAQKPGKIITIDTKRKKIDKHFDREYGDAPKFVKDIWHNRVKVFTGSSISTSVFDSVVRYSESLGFSVMDANCMVFLDSDHHVGHVLRELEIYHCLVKSGYHLIVEDTNITKSIHPEYYPGPWAAVVEFLSHNKEFIIDTECEKFVLTTNPGGFLKEFSCKQLSSKI